MKLVPNLRKKERYIIHYRKLKLLYQSLGMQVTGKRDGSIYSAEHRSEGKGNIRV